MRDILKLDNFFNVFDDLDAFGDIFTSPFIFSTLGRKNIKMVEDDKNHYVEVVLPGFRQNQVIVEVNDGILNISATREHGRDGPKLISKTEQKFNQKITIPFEIDVEKISAEYKSGILLIALPKKINEKLKKTISVAWKD